MPEVRLIDANALWVYIANNSSCYIDCCPRTIGAKGILACIDEQPTIEAKPVRHGRWIFGSSKTSCWMTCSICRKSQSGQTATFSYCPNCGAEMLNENN